MSQNPNWTKDELILALDLYFKLDPSRLSPELAAIQDLSTLLNSLPFHPRSKRQNNFRNPVGVSMTLRTFLRWDPTFAGRGLQGGKLGKTVWDEYANDKVKLSSIAKAIRTAIPLLQEVEYSFPIANDEETFPEGRILTALHRARERNSLLVKRKKLAVRQKTGRLACEICDFDFERAYGVLGTDFAECHHLTPLANLARNKASKLSDLAILCANCHRMIHRTSPIKSVVDLQTLVHQYQSITTSPRSKLSREAAMQTIPIS